MRLKDWLYFNRISQVQLSEDTGYDRSYLGLIINEKRIPGRKLMKLLVKYTRGEVTEKDFEKIEIKLEEDI